MNTLFILSVALLAIGVYSAPSYMTKTVEDEDLYKLDADDKYTYGNFSTCSKSCDGGSMTRPQYCRQDDGTYEFCNVIVYQCSLNHCDDPYIGAKFTECTKSCGGGTRYRTSNNGTTHTIYCNTQLCENKHGLCEADIIFVLDSSGSISSNDFYEIKQFTMDVVSAMSIGENLTHVGAITFSTRVFENIQLSEGTERVALLEQLWNIPFLAGMTNTADALMEMRQMSMGSMKTNKTQVAIVLTDGHSNIDHERTAKEAKLAHEDGIEIIVIGIGMTKDDEEMKAIASSEGNYYSVKSVSAIMDITNIIIKDTCTKPKRICTKCVYMKCSASCGQQGISVGTHNCTISMNGKETIKAYACEEQKCQGECTTTTEATTTTTTTTTVATTTVTLPDTTPETDQVKCHKCDFTQGQNWRPDTLNCHSYYICEKTLVQGKYIIHHMSCGNLYWDQDLATCVRKPQPGCNKNATPMVTVKSTGTTPKPECTYKTNPKNARQFKPKKGDYKYQTCPKDMHFDDSATVCTCLRDAGKPDTCKDDMLLHFPYDKHLNDVTCKHAQSVQVGDKVVIVDDAVRGKVAKFNGHGYLEVPFLRKWFAGHTVREFSIAFFFKATDKTTKKSTVVSNGDCKESATFESGYTNSKVYYQGKADNGKVDEVTLSTVKVNVWYHVAWVYNGHTLILYVNGKEVSRKAMTGPLINTDVPMAVGARCGEFYHTGLVDEVQVYARALSAKEVLALSLQ